MIIIKERKYKIKEYGPVKWNLNDLIQNCNKVEVSHVNWYPYGSKEFYYRSFLKKGILEINNKAIIANSDKNSISIPIKDIIDIELDSELVVITTKRNGDFSFYYSRI